MEREELRTLGMDHPWTPKGLHEHFAVIFGGLAYPGRRPGHAVVVGLLYAQAKEDFEAHVLGETESEDLGVLLRACRGLASRYRMPGMWVKEPFRWIGNGKHAGANRIMWKLNDEVQGGHGRDRITVESATILDTPQPYLSLLAILRDHTQGARKTLYLHGSRVAHAMTEIRSDEVADTLLGEYPAIEALGFALDALRSWFDTYVNRPPIPRNGGAYRNWPRFTWRGR